ncbi:hypothetical protein VB780_07450 [Leptolyngbya sp. CCNP1308]|uniref:hypothetical protein n=1 Tax=Leptolyngbya sp. CCNP1308 TaxID=3110255 RepID=UPI002B212466|nr:hypothetical protein [Leptolyngbya sp. CCNP1308]MEA5448396.1 hypothetical protein [Leptolyngbya sp. CCNP1308]
MATDIEFCLSCAGVVGSIQRGRGDRSGDISAVHPEVVLSTVALTVAIAPRFIHPVKGQRYLIVMGDSFRKKGENLITVLNSNEAGFVHVVETLKSGSVTVVEHLGLRCRHDFSPVVSVNS